MDLDITFSEQQDKAYQTLKEFGVKYVLYGGAKGGGKSVFGCYWVMLRCLEIIKEYNIPYMKYPIAVCFMGRKRGVDFTDTTLETWKRFIPQDMYQIKIQDKEIIIQNRVKIVFGGFDDEANVKKFNSAEFAFGFIDQAEEVTQDDIGLLRGTLRLKINKDIDMDYKVLLTANPAECWLKDEFMPPINDGYRFIRALPTDNPYLPKDYVDNLIEAFKHRPELVDAYVRGNWDVLAGGDIVIKPDWVRSSVKSQVRQKNENVLITCDPARFGDDETVIYVLRDGELIDESIYGQKSTMETAGRCVALAKKYNALEIVVDSIGPGGGVCDRITELGYTVREVNFASKPTAEEDQGRNKVKSDYYNLRAEVWWEAATMFSDRAVSIPDDKLLQQQLSRVKYSVERGKIRIESKNEIKKRMSGKSPDRADALVMGLWAFKFQPKHESDYHRQDKTLRDEIADKQYYRDSNSYYNQMLERLSQSDYQKSDYEAN